MGFWQKTTGSARSVASDSSEEESGTSTPPRKPRSGLATAPVASTAPAHSVEKHSPRTRDVLASLDDSEEESSEEESEDSKQRDSEDDGDDSEEEDEDSEDVEDS